MRVHVGPSAHDLALEVENIEGGCEIFVNGVRIGAIGNMDSIQQDQSDLTFYSIPDSTLAPDGSLVLALRFALNGTNRRGLGMSTPVHGDSILLASRAAASRDASYVAAHQGVVEARNTKGELFGFDRTAAISTQAAESIASTAQNFGQEDDITVVTLSLTT